MSFTIARTGLKSNNPNVTAVKGNPKKIGSGKLVLPAPIFDVEGIRLQRLTGVLGLHSVPILSKQNLMKLNRRKVSRLGVCGRDPAYVALELGTYRSAWGESAASPSVPAAERRDRHRPGELEDCAGKTPKSPRLV